MAPWFSRLPRSAQFSGGDSGADRRIFLDSDNLFDLDLIFDVDSDNLFDLDLIFDVVRAETETHVVQHIKVAVLRLPRSRGPGMGRRSTVRFKCLTGRLLPGSCAPCDAAPWRLCSSSGQVREDSRALCQLDGLFKDRAGAPHKNGCQRHDHLRARRCR